MAEIQKIKTNEINDVDLNLIQNGSIIGGNTNVVSNMTTNIEEIDLGNVSETETPNITEEVPVVEPTVINTIMPTEGRHETYGNTTYAIPDEELRKIAFVVNHECNGSYEDALGVISVILNRIEDGRYNATTPLEIVSQPGQFAVWDANLASSFSLKNVKSPNVLNALNDALTNGKRNNDYIEFKASNSSDYDRDGNLKIQLVEGGNKYHRLAQHINRMDNPNQ